MPFNFLTWASAFIAPAKPAPSTQVSEGDLACCPIVETNFLADRRWLLIFIALFAAVFITFYPRLYTSIDEASTFRMAFVLRHGWLVPHDEGFYPSVSPVGIHGRMYRFPIGFPAMLALFTFAGWQAMFLVNPLLHLIATWCFGRILQANRVSAKYAVLYLLYPCFILFTRTLFSDAFAASLTTIGLFFLICHRAPLPAGLCLGLSLAARAASLPVAGLMFIALLCSDWRRRKEQSPWRGIAMRFSLGLLPFLLANALYNNYTMGGPLRSPYVAEQLSWHGLLHMGPTYALSLLLIFPGMLLAPVIYRGVFWKTGLAATTLVFLLAASYDESTYGNNALQTLLSSPRQLLPVLPFYLLAYCTLLAKWLPEIRLRRFRVFESVGVLMLIVAVAISALHQKYLQRLVLIQAEIAASLPTHSIIYANKDVYKLHQPLWDSRTCRELPFVSNAQAAADLQSGPVYVMLFIRSRGFTAEDVDNAKLLADLRARFVLAPIDLPSKEPLHGYQVIKVRLSAKASGRGALGNA